MSNVIKRPWDADEIETLKAMCADGQDDTDIAKALNRTKASVGHKRTELGFMRGNNRQKAPVPDTFAEIATESETILCRHFGVSRFTIARWRRELGVVIGKGQSKARAVPADFVSVFPAMSIRELAEHFKASKETINKWRAACGLPEKPSSEKKDIPADFAKVAPTLTRNALLTHYLVSNTTLTRWIRESGVQPATHDPRRIDIPADFASAARVMTNDALIKRFGVSAPTIRRWRDRLNIPSPGHVRPVAGYTRVSNLRTQIHVPTSLADRAARHLQKVGYIPVCRSTVFDRKNDPNDWRVGNRTMSSGDMIDLAEAKGFNADEWKVLTA